MAPLVFKQGRAYQLSRWFEVYQLLCLYFAVEIIPQRNDPHCTGVYQLSEFINSMFSSCSRDHPLRERSPLCWTLSTPRVYQLLEFINSMSSYCSGDHPLQE